ncbi:MAG: hypothetical protein ABSG86_30485 [Thermoguttaceae bacterium]
MLHLHDQTRRRIALAAFFALGIVPTAMIGAWCVLRQGPWDAWAESQRLGRQLGMDVALGTLRHPRPGRVVYEGLRLSDPETGQEVLRTALLEATWTVAVDGRGRRPAVVLAAPQVEVEIDGTGRLWQILQQNLRLQCGRPEIEVRVKVDELVIRGGEHPLALAHVEGGIGALSGGVQAVASFHLAGRAAAAPVRARLVRNRQLRPPADSIELDTAGTPLPCPLLALAVPGAAWLDPSSRFAGSIASRQTAGGWEGEVSGQCLGIDLDRLVSDHFPYRLSGPADLTIRRARFRDGRLDEAEAMLAAGPGVIDRRLLDAAAAQLRLSGALPQTPAGGLVPYDQLSVGITLDARGLWLQGLCQNAEPGTILRAGQVRLLGEPQSQPQPVTASIRALLPAGGEAVMR